MNWWGQRACAGIDPNLFYPSKGEGSFTDVNRALKVCRACPVADPCLDWWLEICPPDDDHCGIVGATTANMRKEIRRTRKVGVAA